ncbi:type I secretion C-terminal target domain (VC_A0849 subclass) [Modicisalibacter muralis]|uniref:Type I secretion C-terminal target domain (VC_A0849 subclass) n=1 Tax=Modicisalibacter muralis TaxID=119000 RepID=A0A1G9FBI5_9GAMM|nr:retention module-containing protein [Halomonas muralis]SDK85603.1 type I secretion C-terminal target domain (VC_A0849 subclass) [Halomonas muralis]
MSTPIATVLSVTGQAWARDADGNLRVLEPGDVLLEGETLITSDNGRVRLDFGDAEPVAIGPGQSIAMLAELNADNPVPEDEAATTDESVEALLAAIEAGEGDLLDVLDPTAAGLGGGGEGGGHTFVRLARINLDTDSLAFDYQPPQLDTLIDAQGESLALADEIDENGAPTATDDSGSGLEGTSLNGNVLANDSDIDGDALTVTQFQVNGVGYQAGETAMLEGIGSLVVNGDGSYTFTPVANWNGQVPVVSYTVSDGDLSDTATLELSVTPVNDTPVGGDDNATNAADDALTTAEDTALIIDPATLLANDGDVDGDELSITGVGNATNGTVVLNADGTITFTPAENYNGEATFDYTVSDGQASDTASVTVAVTPVNDTPQGNDDNTADAANDALTTPEDTALSIDPQTLLANDSDVDGDDLFIGAVDGEARDAQGNVVGTVTATSDNAGRVTQITFTPNANYNGQATFDYTVSDGQASDTASVTVDVTPVNDAPVAQDDTNSVGVGGSVTATGGQNGQGVLSNDSDIDGDIIRVSQVDGNTLADGGSLTVDGLYGTLQIDSTGAYTYTSTLSTPVLYGFNGSDGQQLDGNLLGNFALSSEAQQRVSITEEGVGVSEGAPNHPRPEQISETGDVLIADLGAPVNSVTFGVARLFNDESGGESGQWFAYDASGNLVGSGQFGPESVDYEDGSNHVGTVTIGADDVDGDFQFIAFESLDYQNGSENAENDGGDYLVTGITVQDTFDYTIVDDQGGDASATLTVDSSASLIGYQTPPDSAAEPEASITIDMIAGDDVINDAEYGQQITITGSVEFDAREGDTVTLNVGGNRFEGQVDAEGNYSIQVFGGTLGEFDQISASVSGQNAAGNDYEASTTRDYSVDTQASATISIDEIAGDDEINGDESSQTITITGTVGDDAREGDIVTLTIGDEEIAGQVKADGSFSIGVPGSLLADNNQVTASVTGSDAVGNVFSAADTRGYTVNYAPQANSDKDAIDESGQLSVDAENGVLANDTDQNGDTLTITEINGDTGKVGTAIAGNNGGIFTLNDDGSYSFDPNGEFDLLAADQSKTTSLNYTVSDGDGGTDKATLTVTVTGTDDAPTISGDDTGAVIEDASDPMLTYSGTLVIDDPDANQSAIDTSVAPVASNGALGSLSIAANGEWSYEVANADVQYLAEGETKLETFTVTTVDSTTHDIVVSITGTNDAPEIKGLDDGLVAEDINVNDDSQLIDIGTLEIDDADADQSAIDTGVPVQASTGALGSLSITADGTWTYEVANADVQYLAEGETKLETFTVTTVDGTPHDVTITIMGTNDVPTISGAASGAVTEDGQADQEQGTAQSATGQLAVTDVDASDSHTWSLSGDGQGDYGTLTVDQTGQWVYTLDNAAAQNLGAGDQVTETYSVQVDDSNGGIATQTVTITITGTNDVPVINGDDSGAVTEDASVPTLSDNGTLEIVDTDADQSAIDTNVPVQASEGVLGSLTINANGGWTYEVANAEVQYLAEDETKDETFTVTTLDGTTHDIVVTITGTNDTPVISGQASGAVTEDGGAALTVSGDLDLSDIDTTDGYTGSVDGDSDGDGQVTGAYGTITVGIDGQWTYVLDNTSNAVQSLAADQEVTDTFTVQADDGHGGIDTQSIVVTITGTNDAPVISGEASGAVTEDATQSATGQLSVADVDTSDTHTWSVTGDSTTDYGSFTVDASGQWTYTLNNASPAVQALTSGERITETFSVTVDDGHNGSDTQEVSVTITGTEDAAEVSGDDTGAVTEDANVNDDFQLTDSGTLVIDDADTNQSTIDTSVAVQASEGALGSLTINANGEWSYEVANAEVQYLGEGEKKTETFTVTTVDGTEHNVVVTITGTNDIPTGGDDTTTNTADDALTTAEDTALVIQPDMLLANDDDADGDTLTITGVSNASNGTVVLNTDGSITFTPAENYNGDATFDYTVSDGTAGDTATVTVEVTPVNDVPEFIPDNPDYDPQSGNFAVTTEEDTAVHGSVAAEDIDGDTLTYSLGDGPAHGTVELDSASGEYTYTPTTDYHGDDSFSVTVSDGQGGEITSTVAIEVTPVSDANPDTITVAEDASVTTDVLANDTFGAGAKVTGVTQGANGSVTVTDAGIIYTPAANYHGPDSYTYTVTTAAGNTETTTVTVAVTPVNDTAEVSGDDLGAVTEDIDVNDDSHLTDSGTLSVADTDDGEATFDPSSVQASPSALGSLTITANGGWTYEVANADVQYLADGETKDETFTVTTVDGTTHDIVVTITGTEEGRLIVPQTTPNDDNDVPGGFGGDIILGDTGGTQTTVEPGKNYNISLIIDTSGSMEEASGTPGLTRMELVKAAMGNLVDQMEGHDGTINIQLVSFASNSVYETFDNITESGIEDILAAIDDLDADGGTNYEAGFNDATDWFGDQSNGYENLSFFLTDGKPTYYLDDDGDVRGDGNNTDYDTFKNSVDAFEGLSDISTVHGIGIGDGINEEYLKFFDNTKVSPTDGTVSFGTKTETVSDDLSITDENDDSATTAISSPIMIANSNSSLSFDYDISGFSWWGEDNFSWRLEKFNRGDWEATDHHGSDDWGRVTFDNIGPGQYQLVYTVEDKTGGWIFEEDANVSIDNVTLTQPAVVTGPVGEVSIVNNADDLDAALQGGSTSIDPVDVGDDTIDGGKGDDIIFGDTINTDNLSSDLPDGSGLEALKAFLKLQNGHSPTDAELYDYIEANHEALNVGGDARGGNDTLNGGEGNDILYGQGGDDTLTGGTGSDTLYGGFGADTFAWEFGDEGEVAAPASDTVMDFNAGEGDKLDLSELLQDHESGDDISSFIQATQDGGSTTLHISTTGNLGSNHANADQTISLAGVDMGGKSSDVFVDDLIAKGQIDI